MKIFIWVAVIALVVFLTLLISARIANFDSIGELINYILAQLK